MTLRIVTEFVHPPIPDRRFDWAATLDNYEPGCPSGSGRTEAEAIKDLLDRLDENDNGTTCKDKGGYVGPRGECLVCGADEDADCRRCAADDIGTIAETIDILGKLLDRFFERYDGRLTKRLEEIWPMSTWVESGLVRKFSELKRELLTPVDEAAE